MKDILAFGAHPDDVEFGCGGILARMAAEGKSIVIADLTLGQKATHGTPDIRKKEALAAAQLIGAERIFLDFEDCELADTYEGRLELVKVIRKYKPRLVLAPLWKGEQNHPDHIANGLMARHACRYARFGKILSDIAIHRVEGILHYLPTTQYMFADFLMDISGFAEIWIKMMQCHESQMETLNYIELNKRAAALLGGLIGKEYAQGLAKGNPVEINDLMTISKGTFSM